MKIDAFHFARLINHFFVTDKATEQLVEEFPFAHYDFEENLSSKKTATQVFAAVAQNVCGFKFKPEYSTQGKPSLLLFTCSDNLVLNLNGKNYMYYYGEPYYRGAIVQVQFH